MKKFFIVIVFLFFSIFVYTVFCAFCCVKEYKQYAFYHVNGLYVFQFNLKGNLKLIPYVSDGLETVESIAKNNGAIFAINTGFFDAANKKTVSYIYDNNIYLADPNTNENLLSNPVLFKNLDKILNRTELRLYDCDNIFSFDIVSHNAPIKDSCSLVHSTQAGPMLFPDNTMEDEFFVQFKEGKVVRDSISLLTRKPRSFVGILDNNKIFFFITDEKTSLNVYEILERIKPFKLDKVMGFDGGGSVSMYVKDKNIDFYYSAEKDGISRPIKSALIIK